jgi:AAA domain-containing protein
MRSAWPRFQVLSSCGYCRRRAGTVVVVLVWINGPFGGGKTASAVELQRRLPGSVICDPEHLGYGLRRMLPGSLRSDFQDLQAWRSGVHEVLDLVARKHVGVAIVPMTLIDHRYFAQVVGRLRDEGHDVRHFALLAERATVLRRLNRRGFGFGLKRERWAIDRLDNCLARLHEPEFAHHIHTDQLTVPQVADTIAGIAGLPVVPDTDGQLRASLRRYATTIRHIRFEWP